MTIANLFLSPKGRIGRLAYFLGTVSHMVAGGLLLALAGAIGGGGPTAAIPILIVLVAVIYVGWVLNIKRAHDLGKSGGWVLIHIGLMPVIGGGFAFAGLSASQGGSPGTGLLLSLVALAANISVLYNWVRLIFFRGEDRINTFGPPSTFLTASGDDDAFTGVPAQTASGPLARLQSSSPATPVDAVVSRPAPSRAIPPRAKPTGFGRRGMTPA